MEYSCSICLEKDEEELLTFKCNHTFHVKCVIRWANIKNTCPECRTKIEFNYESILKMCKIVSEIESPRSADIDIHIYQRRIQELRRQAIFDNFYILNRIENERFTQLRSSQMDTNEQGDIIESVRLLYI
jgi:hypothetical protein